MTTLKHNPILAADSYKCSHYLSYPKNVTGMFSYIEARSKNDVIVPFGLQMLIKKFLLQPITMANIDEAEAFTAAHGEPFDRSGWEHILTNYGGVLPVRIRALPEGTPIRGGHAIVTIECTDPKVFWLSSYLETLIQRGVWYPTTIASMDHAIKRDIKRLYELTGADLGLLPFSLHDFGGRGVTCAEQAEIGGAAHLVNFMGSDTMEGIRAANFYYKEQMAAFSVPATEHSVECSFGGDIEGENAYLDHVLTNLAKPGGIVSIVIDGFDVYRAAQTLCTTFKDKVIASGAKVVFRPDSGDMMEVVPRILELQAATFGYDVNAKGYKKVKTVGIIQGDGVDHMAIQALLGKIISMGYAADNVIFGSGGALLQKVNRDTFKFAQKASAIRVRTYSHRPDEEGEYTERWVGIAKNPITDPGKKSKQGRLSLAKSRLTGEFMTYDLSSNLDVEFEDVMVLVYDTGVQFNETTLAEVRARAAV